MDPIAAGVQQEKMYKYGKVLAAATAMTRVHRGPEWRRLLQVRAECGQQQAKDGQNEPHDQPINKPCQPDITPLLRHGSRHPML
ncbi:hypothetical protein E2C01_006844 [Portunus trituberculatus]|uniref:Uncharacterized protein n=1 Tax=Portunus trituberculatus TaxID=210409 RepID=A0A5B7CWG5_PORTR|nr:hypothetical protein [Portunus trituberculatus]